MKKDDMIYVGHILEATEKIHKYCSSMKKTEFLRNDLVKDAVVRNIEIIGEAAKKLSSEFRRRYPEIPWKDISGMRDKIVHDYTGIDYRVVWDVVQTDLPDLKIRLKNITKQQK
jgi:uncharacterized protein with HEPN domain